MSKVDQSAMTKPEFKEIAPELPQFIGYKIIRSNYDIGGNLHWDDCCIHNGLAWFFTKNAPVTISREESAFEKVLKNSRKKWPDAVFKVVKAYQFQNGEIPVGELSEVALENLKLELESETKRKTELNKIQDEAWDITQDKIQDEIQDEDKIQDEVWNT